MNNTRSIDTVGRTPGFTPQANRDIKLPSQEGKDRYQVFGKDILRPTWIWIRPHQIPDKIAKYALWGQWLEGYPPGTEIPVVAGPEPKEKQRGNRSGRTLHPVVCTSTGVRYESITAASAATGVPVARISHLCRKRNKVGGKGLDFEYAPKTKEAK